MLQLVLSSVTSNILSIVTSLRQISQIWNTAKKSIPKKNKKCIRKSSRRATHWYHLLFSFSTIGGNQKKNPENLTFFSNFVIKKQHMRKNSNDMKHCGVYLIRLKKKKNSIYSRSRTYKLSPPQPTFCLTALCEFSSPEYFTQNQSNFKKRQKKNQSYFFFFCIQKSSLRATHWHHWFFS